MFGNVTLQLASTLKNGVVFDGMVLPTFWNSDLPEKVPFQGVAKQLWGTLEGVSARSATAFDAVYAVINALKLDPNISREELPTLLRSSKLSFNGVTGKVAFQASGERRGGEAILVQVKLDPKIATGYRLAMLSVPSLGERILATSSQNIQKEAGAQAFAQKKYAEAISYFQSALRNEPSDPETRIYLNNARAMKSGKFLKIATSVPLGNNLEIAQQILRGVAQAQEEINQKGELMVNAWWLRDRQ